MSSWALLALIALTLAGSLNQTPASGTGAPPVSACMNEGARLVGSQPIEARGKLHLPKKRKHVQPLLPSLPPGTTASDNVWIGEALIDEKGRTVRVWTLRQPRLTPELPGVTDAITAAVQQWEYEPAHIDKVARPLCRIISFTIDTQ